MHLIMPAWRNGRRDRLKIYCQRWREGSSPLAGTIRKSARTFRALINNYFRNGLVFLCLRNYPKKKEWYYGKYY